MKFFVDHKKLSLSLYISLHLKMESAISMFKREDEKMAEALQFIVPIYRGTNTTSAGPVKEYGPATYQQPGEPAIWEKENYAKLLTKQDVQPVVNITQEDIDVLKEKQYKSVEMDFNNYVGALLKPNENPANKAFLNKIYPGWFDKQRKAVENWHETKKRMENLMIMGPRNEEDLFMLYRLGYDPSKGGVGEDTDHKMGRFQPLIEQIKSDRAPGIGKGLPADDAATMVNFQRGIFNQDRKELYTKALGGYPHSVFKEFETAPKVTLDNENATRDSYRAAVKPLGTGLGKPVFWQN